MNKKLRVQDYLGHFLKATERIGRYTEGMDEATFLNSELVQNAVLHNIKIIGEASNKIQRIAPEFSVQHASILWLVMYTMRNRISGRLGNRLDTIQSYLPNLCIKIINVNKYF